MDIDGVGEQLSYTLLKDGLVKGPADLYTLTKKQLLELERMGEKSAHNVIAAIDASRSRPLSRVLFALGIRHVGSETADLLAGHFGSIEALMDASEEELAAIATIGPIVAQNVHAYFEDKQSRALIKKLQNGGVQMKAAAPAMRDGPLSGQSFVISGTLADFSRPEAEARIRSLGGATGSSVTKKTDVLIVGKSPGSKLKKAQRYGTTVLNNDEFIEMLRQHGAA
jgi:DNA ligase (NAD+)